MTEDLCQNWVVRADQKFTGFLCSLPLAGAWYLTSNTRWASFSYPVSSSAASIILQILEVNLSRIHSNWVLWKCTASRVCLLLGAADHLASVWWWATLHYIESPSAWLPSSDHCTMPWQLEQLICAHRTGLSDAWKQDSGSPPGCWKGLNLTTSTVCFWLWLRFQQTVSQLK